MSTPFMALTLPAPGDTLGPAWAEELNAALEAVDSHDHTTGKGVPVPVAGLSIDGDLPMNGNSLLGLRAAKFFNGTDSPSGVACLFVKSNELFFTDGAGSEVQLTPVGAASGGFSGLSSPAFASFNSLNGTFKLGTTSSIGGLLGVRELQLYPDNIASGNYIRLRAPTGLAATRSVTFPSAAASGTGQLLYMAPSGVMGFAAVQSPLVFANGILSLPDLSIATAKLADGAVTEIKIADLAVSTAKLAGGSVSTEKLQDSAVETDKIANGAVTLAKLAAANLSASPQITLAVDSNDYVDSGLTLTITQHGRPMIVALCAAEYTSGDGLSGITVDGSSNLYLQLRRNSDVVSYVIVPNGGAVFAQTFPPGALFYAELTLGYGVKTYTVRVKGSGELKRVSLVAYEL